MQRRAFLKLCASSAAIGFAACVPEPLGDEQHSGSASVRPDWSEPGESAAAEDDATGEPRPSEPDERSEQDQPTGDADGGQGSEDDSGEEPDANDGSDAADGTPDSGDAPEEPDEEPECEELALVYDTYAQALYFDGSHGPLTGTITAAMVADGVAVELAFWHGHGGVQHKFHLLPEHFDTLKRGRRVTLETTTVDAHRHQLFIDPTLPRYRVPGSQPLEVPLC
jgi:hypothetical protein